MYTSYFAKLKKFDLDEYCPISISLYPPKWYEGEIYKKLAPTWDILDDWKTGRKDEEAKDYYERMYYKKVLNKLHASEILEELNKIANGKKIILVCFEKSNDFCHRHIVAKWLKDTLDLEVIEL